MLATERLLEIEEAFSEKAQSIVPLELDGETLRLILYLKDGTNLRVTEVAWENARALQLLLAHFCERIEDRLG